MKCGVNCQAPRGADLKGQDKEKGSFRSKRLYPGQGSKLSKYPEKAKKASGPETAPGSENSDQT